MKKILTVTLLAVGLMACSGTDAKADSFSISIGDPYFRPVPAYGYYHPAPVYYSYYEPRRYYPKPHRYYKHRGHGWGHDKHYKHGSHRDGGGYRR